MMFTSDDLKESKGDVMKYSEMTKFLNDNGIYVMQPVIANQVDAQLPIEHNMSEDEFEEICSKIYDIYIGCIEEPDIWYLIDKELIARGYKER